MIALDQKLDHVVMTMFDQVLKSGINLYLQQSGDEWIEYDSVINLRPSHGNVSRGVDDPKIRQKIREIVDQLVQ